MKMRLARTILTRPGPTSIWHSFIATKASLPKPSHSRSAHLKVDEKKLGAEHLDTAKDLIVLANLYRDTAQYTKAEPLYQRALKIREKSLGPNHTTVATTLDELAALYWEKGQSAKAEPLSQRAAGIRARIKEERPPTATKSPATQTN